MKRLRALVVILTGFIIAACGTSPPDVPPSDWCVQVDFANQIVFGIIYNEGQPTNEGVESVNGLLDVSYDYGTIVSPVQVRAIADVIIPDGNPRTVVASLNAFGVSGSINQSVSSSQSFSLAADGAGATNTDTVTLTASTASDTTIIVRYIQIYGDGSNPFDGDFVFTACTNAGLATSTPPTPQCADISLPGVYPTTSKTANGFIESLTYVSLIPNCEYTSITFEVSSLKPASCPGGSYLVFSVTELSLSYNTNPTIYNNNQWASHTFNFSFSGRSFINVRGNIGTCGASVAGSEVYVRNIFIEGGDDLTTPTPLPTNSPTPLASSTPLNTATPLPTSTVTSTPFPTSIVFPTSTPRNTSTPFPTSTPRNTSTPFPTSTGFFTSTPFPTSTQFVAPTFQPTATPDPNIDSNTSGALSAITTTINNAFNGLTTAVNNVTNGITTTISNAVNGITTVMENTRTALVNVAEGVRDAVINTSLNIISAVGNAAISVRDGVVSAINGSVEAIRTFIEDLRDKIRTVLLDIYTAMLNLVLWLAWAVLYINAWLNNLWAMFTYYLLRLVLGSVGLFFDLYHMFNNLIGIVSNLGKSLVSFIVSAFVIVGQILGMWNTTPPQKPPGLPDCIAAPLEYNICAAWYILEFTFFSGIGSFIIPSLSVYLVMLIVFFFLETVVERMQKLWEVLNG